MKVAEVKARVERVRSLAQDFEAAHSEEDKLYADVLSAIARGAKNGQELAAAALQTEYIEFVRVCA